MKKTSSNPRPNRARGGASSVVTAAVPPQKPEKTHEQLFAAVSMAASLNAAGVVLAYRKNIIADSRVNEEDAAPLCEALKETFHEVRNGDLRQMEAMLVGQATALQTIFTSLARRAQAQTSQRNLEAFLGLALKAQAQSRATISALVDLKYPRQQATFVKQANIANGPQQVNNGVSPPAHGRNVEPAQNELLEDQSHGGTYLDTGAAAATGRGDTQVEAVGAGDRPSKRRGKVPV